MPDSEPRVPFGDALAIAVRGLRGQPPLLAGVAIAIVLGIVAVTAGDTARTIALPLVAILVVALLAWVVTDALRVRARKPGVFQNTRFGRWSRQEDVTIRGGKVVASSGDRIEQNVTSGAGSKQKGVTITHGDVTTRDS